MACREIIFAAILVVVRGLAGGHGATRENSILSCAYCTSVPEKGAEDACRAGQKACPPRPILV